MILAIDTSTEQASIALWSEKQVVAENSWNAGRNHSRQLTSSIEQLLCLVSATVNELTGIAVAIGPGSFSGVRVGVSEAKGLAMALEIPLVGISTLDLIAHQCRTRAPTVWSAVHAGRKEVAAAGYSVDGESIRRVSEYKLYAIRQLAESVTPPAHLAGPAVEAVYAALPSTDSITAEHGADQFRRAGYLAELGKRYLDAGGKDQLFEV
jgi:tRNA threonylcarbamoyladenosine biosynthesis protein TsaB